MDRFEKIKSEESMEESIDESIEESKKSPEEWEYSSDSSFSE